MKQASPVKYYFAKYFFLAFGLLQWFIGGLILFRQGSTNKSGIAGFLFFTIGLLFLAVFMLIVSKVKRVAIGKKKVAVFGDRKKKEYEWPDIKSIQYIPFFNMYSMKIRGKKNKIYFLPSRLDAPIFYGLFHEGPGKK